MVPTAWLLALAATPGSGVSLRCATGELWIHAASASPASAPSERGGGTRVPPGADSSIVELPFTFAATKGARFEATTGGIRVALSGPCEGVVTGVGDGLGVLLTAAGSWRVSTSGEPVVLALGSRYLLRAGKSDFEGSFALGAGVALANLSGDPLRIYRDGRMVDLLPEPLRVEIGEASLASASAPRPEEAERAREVRWGERTIAIPAGVHSRVEGGRLLLEGSPALPGSAVVALDRRFVLLRAGGRIEIDAGGSIVATRGPAHALRALGATGGTPGPLGVAAPRAGLVLSPRSP